MSYFTSTNPLVNIITWISGFIIVLVPLLYIFLALVPAFSSYKLRPKWKGTLGWTWALSVIVLSGAMMFQLREYSYQNTINDTSYYEIDYGEINIEMIGDVNRNDGPFISTGELFHNDLGFHGETVRVNLIKSKDPELRIEKIFCSQGRGSQQARENAAKVMYDVAVTDNLISIPRTFMLANKAKYRGQDVVLNIYIPEANKVNYDDNTRWYIRQNDFRKKKKDRD